MLKKNTRARKNMDKLKTYTPKRYYRHNIEIDRITREYWKRCKSILREFLPIEKVPYPILEGDPRNARDENRGYINGYKKINRKRYDAYI